MSRFKSDDTIKAFASAAPLLTNHWRSVMKKLGMTQTTIQEVVSLHRHKRPDEVVYQALLKWQALFSGEVDLDELVAVLLDMGLDEVADAIEKYQKNPRPRIPKLRDAKSIEIVHSDAEEYDSPLPSWLIGYKWSSTSPEMSPEGTIIHSLPSIKLQSPDEPYLASKTVQSPYELFSPSNRIQPHRPEHLDVHIPAERIRGDFGTIVPVLKSREDFGSIVPQVKSRESSVRPPPSSAGTEEGRLPPRLSYSEIATPVSVQSFRPLDSPINEEKPDKVFEYDYVSSLVSPIRQFPREPRYADICFQQDNSIALLDRSNSQIELHECQRIFDGKRFVFKRAFRIPGKKNTKLTGLAAYQNVIIVLDEGDNSLRFFTSKGKQAGEVKFHNQPKCIALRDSRAAIAFWNPNINKGSIVTYRVNIAEDKKGEKKLSLFLPNPISGVTNKYAGLAITDAQDIVALTTDGRLLLFGFKSQLSSTYVCQAVVDSNDLRCVRCSKNGVIVCNGYRDMLSYIPIVGDDTARKFDVKNSTPLLNEEDGLNGLRAFAVQEETNDKAVINNFGEKVYMYGNRKIKYRDT